MGSSLFQYESVVKVIYDQSNRSTFKVKFRCDVPYSLIGQNNLCILLRHRLATTFSDVLSYSMFLKLLKALHLMGMEN